MIFHNLKGFDGNFIIEELYKQGMKVVDHLTTGAKTLKFTYFYETADITFKDFLCFIPMALSKLPGMFNFEELLNGWLPHAFHTRENLSYRGPIPAKEYFQPQAMKPKKRKEFDTWYVAQVEKNEVYDLWKELNKYCHSDVMVLKAACKAFIQKFQEEAGLNLFKNCAAIASDCNLFYRQDLLPENTIAIEPMNGWCGANLDQSHIALEWLCYEDSNLGGNKIRHVSNGGEQKVITPAESLFVDGYNAQTKRVYEFHGCFFHGCRKCFPRQRHTKHNCHADRTISKVYEATCKKTNHLRQAGYKVIEKWEHDFEVDKKSNPAVIQFLKTFELIEPLNPRNSFFRCRTNGARLHCEAQEGEEIRHLDITSLYPHVNKNKINPVGHPHI